MYLLNWFVPWNNSEFPDKTSVVAGTEHSMTLLFLSFRCPSAVSSILGRCLPCCCDVAAAVPVVVELIIPFRTGGGGGMLGGSGGGGVAHAVALGLFGDGAASRQKALMQVRPLPRQADAQFAFERRP